VASTFRKVHFIGWGAVLPASFEVELSPEVLVNPASYSWKKTTNIQFATALHIKTKIGDVRKINGYFCETVWRVPGHKAWTAETWCELTRAAIDQNWRYLLVAKDFQDLNLRYLLFLLLKPALGSSYTRVGLLEVHLQNRDTIADIILGEESTRII